MKFSPTTLKQRLILTFSGLLVIILSLSTVLVFGKMKNLILFKHVQSAHNVGNIGMIPLIDAMLSAETGNPLPQEYFDRTLKTLRSDPEQQILYIYFFDKSAQNVLSKNVDIRWTEFSVLPSSGEIIYKVNGRWILEATARVGISTKTWGYLVIGFDATTVLKEVKQALTLILSVSLLVILTTLVAVNIISNRVTKRLDKMMVAMEEFDLDKEDIELPEGEDEIGRLGIHFKEMRDRLIQSRSKVKESERIMFQAEKLASVGRLAAGIAHEINNPLTGIRHAISNILSNPNDVKDREEYLTLTDEALGKIESVIGKLLGYSRKEKDQSLIASFSDAINGVVQLLDYNIQSKKIQFEVESQEKHALISGSQQLVDEIVMNLILNAIDSVKEKGKIKCKIQVISKEVIFTIKDDGYGISEENMQRLFEPFFTTKEVGKGTGLGLYVTREIVQGLGGKIEVLSQIDNGAKFIVSLPVRI